MNKPKTPEKLTLYKKIVLIVGGFLLGILAIVIFLKVFNSFWGGIVGNILNLAFYFYIKKKKSDDKTKQILAIGVLSSIIFTFALAIAIWIFATVAFQSIAG